MRVVSGSARGHKLIAPEGEIVRPTADRIKESVFNMISVDIYGARFLDLFGGSGAMGIEALSRGCEFCVFVEISADNCDIIKRNLAHVSKAVGHNRYKVINASAEAAVKNLSGEGQFDIVFMDPPYHRGLVDISLQGVYEYNILSDKGFVIAEQGITEAPPASPYFEIYKQKTYGKTNIFFLR